MADLPAAHRVLRGAGSRATDRLSLTHADRFLRRKRVVTDDGAEILVDLPETTGLAAGDALELEDGGLIAIVAAEEPVLVVTGDLPRLAWHVGSRHTPCEIGPDALVIAEDDVLEAMLRGLGATVSRASRPFAPEGGAHGLGRAARHAIGTAHGPAHGHAEAHGADHHAQVHHHGSHRHEVEDDEPPAEP